MNCIFSVDVEDWFHILDVPSTPGLIEWSKMPSRVERNFIRLLDIFEEHSVHVTCFFLGWIAEKYPHLVREAHKRGHDIASHSYSHELVYKMSIKDFTEDARKAKLIIEDIVGVEVLGFRATGFSVTEQTPWFFECIASVGYKYDSSIFPGSRAHGGMRTNRLAPYRIDINSDWITEFPISLKKVFGIPICFFGGGYLRLFPLQVIKHMARRVLNEGRPVVFYVHPRDIDPEQPRLPMNLMRKFKSYINLEGTEAKIRNILDSFEFLTFKDYIQRYPVEARVE